MNAQLAPVAHAPEAHTIWASPVLTVIAPVYNEEALLPLFYRRVIAALESLDEPFELLLIDDGSRDRSYEIMRTLYERDARARVVSFSRNFGHQMAISAGLDLARGHAVIIMDARPADARSERLADGALQHAAHYPLISR
jgi:dolichol-phosphate mannosyltransferase